MFNPLKAAKALTKAQRDEYRYVYCASCGHSAGPMERLSIGRDSCGQTLIPISLADWFNVAPNLRLTDLGRALLSGEPQ